MTRRTEAIIVVTVIIALALSAAGYATGRTAGGIIGSLPMIALVLAGYLAVLACDPDTENLRVIRRVSWAS
jgi:hypothetical protein